MQRVLVCGSRNYSDWDKLKATLDAIHKLDPIEEVINGRGRGADDLACRWAVMSHVRLSIYPAAWKTHGKAAGPIRNQRMLDDGHPDLVVAFPVGKLSDSRGTRDMVQRARNAGVRTIVVGIDDLGPVTGAQSYPPLGGH